MMSELKKHVKDVALLDDTVRAKAEADIAEILAKEEEEQDKIEVMGICRISTKLDFFHRKLKMPWPVRPQSRPIHLNLMPKKRILLVTVPTRVKTWYNPLILQWVNPNPQHPTQINLQSTKEILPSHRRLPIRKSPIRIAPAMLNQWLITSFYFVYF